MNSTRTSLPKRILNKFEIPNGLTEIDRSILLLKKSNKTQRMSVLINLPTILRDFPEAEVELLPKIFKEVLSWDEDLQVEGGASLAVIIENKQLTSEGFDKLYAFIIESLESWNNAKWDIVYEQYVLHLPEIDPDESKLQSVIDKGVELSFSLSELSQAIPSRGTGARLMAMLSGIIDKSVAKKKLLPRMKILCHDFNWEVRKAISGSINNLFNLLEPTEGDKHLHPIIIELLDDEEAEVKNLAIEGFLDNIDKFSEKNIEENLLPIVMNLIIEISSSTDAKEHVIIERFDKVIQDSEFIRKILCSPEFIEKQQSKEIWNKMIFNSSLFIKTMGSDFFFKHFIGSYSEMIKQDIAAPHEWESIDTPAKINIIEDLHKVVKNLGVVEGSKNNFDKHIFSFMLDKYLPAQGKMLEKIYDIYEVLDCDEMTEEAKEIDFDNSKILSNFMKNFIKMEETISSNWRYLNLWIDGAFRIVLRMHKREADDNSKTDGASTTLK